MWWRSRTPSPKADNRGVRVEDSPESKRLLRAVRTVLDAPAEAEGGGTTRR